MKNHLKLIHQIDIKLTNESDSKDFCGSQMKISQYCKFKQRDSIEASISRLIAIDGLPYSKIVTSYELRSLLKSKGYINI